MRYTIYVNSQHGSDSNTGELLSPVATLSYALSQVYEGGNIVLQTGTGASYGNLSVTKNVSVIAAYGASPVVGSVSISGAQGLIEGLTFSDPITGVTVSNLSVGSYIIRGCYFNGVDTPVNIDSVNYVSIHRNHFDDFVSGVHITNAVEVCLSSNIFSNGQRSIEVNSVGRLDLWRNTVYGALNMPPIPNPDTNLRVIYKTLTAFDVSYKMLQLPGFASPTVDGRYDVAFNVVNGPSFNYSTDFTVIYSGSMISWDGLLLDGQFAVGDIVRVEYSETGEVGSGDAIRLEGVFDSNSRVDSNSLSGVPGTPIDIGVYFNTPVKIAHNNFDYVNTWWDGIPTGATGIKNIGETAMYRDPAGGDFRLQASSPNIDKGDPGRWSDVYNEIGVIKVDGNYTASASSTRINVAPFDRDIDFDMFHHGATGIQGETGDIGAFEFNHNETAMGNYVSEFGYDVSYPGTETGPYATVDYGFRRSGSNELYIGTNKVPYQSSPTGPYAMPGFTGSSYGRYRSKNMMLSDSELIVGTRTVNDVVIIYPSYPSYETGMVYVSPDGDDSWTGTLSSPYRTVGRALEDGSDYVLVEPGYYPTFTGVTGINLIGIEKSSNVGLSGILYTNARDGSWTGAAGTYSVSSDSVSLIAPTDVMGRFVLNGDIDFKFYATVESDCLTIRLFNTNNSMHVKINRAYSVISYGYTSGGSTYETSSYVSGGTPEELFSDLKVNFIIKGSKFSIYVDSEYFHGSYSNIFTVGSIINWNLRMNNTGLGTDTVSDLSSLSGSITGATGVHQVVVLKKMFGIYGSTGLQV